MRVMLYKMQGMLRRWRVLCKEQAVLQVDVLVAKLEDKEKRTALRLGWQDSAIQEQSWGNQAPLESSWSSGGAPRISLSVGDIV